MSYPSLILICVLSPQTVFLAFWHSLHFFFFWKVRHVLMFAVNVGRSQRIQYPPVFLFFSSLLILCFLLRQSAFYSSFHYNPLSLHWSPVGVVIQCGRREAFCNVRIKSQFKPESLGCDPHQCFIII